MNFYESFSMAMKNIRSSKTRSILTMLGIIIGVAAVIVITGLGSGMEKYMLPENFAVLRAQDTVKFVVKDYEDLCRARDVIREYDLTEKCHVYLSPVYGQIELENIVNFMKDNRLNDVNMQLQMHKIIWDSEMRGV